MDGAYCVYLEKRKNKTCGDRPIEIGIERNCKSAMAGCGECGGKDSDD